MSKKKPINLTQGARLAEKIRYVDLKERHVEAVTVHGGRFHADDVCCVALCQLIQPSIKVVRTRDPDEYEGLCCDVGGGRYDHHPKQGEKKETRKNGVYYAAFGKLWRDIGMTFCKERFGKNNARTIMMYFDKYFIETIDAKDNGLFGYKGYPRTIPMLDVDIFNKLAVEETEAKCFDNAVEVAKISILHALNVCERYILQDAADKKAEQIVKSAVANMIDGVLILPQQCNWEKAASALGKSCLMVVLPEKNGYVAYGVPNDGPGSIRRCYFPKEWAVGTDAAKASGIPQMAFCYNPSGFMAAFRGCGAKEAAIKACRMAIAKRQGEQFVV